MVAIWCSGSTTTARQQASTKIQITSIVWSLSNLGRDAVAPPLALDHAVARPRRRRHSLRILESPVKPAHRRGSPSGKPGCAPAAPRRPRATDRCPADEQLHAPGKTCGLRRCSASRTFSTTWIWGHCQTAPAPCGDAWKTSGAGWCREGITAIDGRGHCHQLWRHRCGAQAGRLPSLERKRIRLIHYRATGRHH